MQYQHFSFDTQPRIIMFFPITIDQLHRKLDDYDMKNDPLRFRPDIEYQLVNMKELLIEHSKPEYEPDVYFRHSHLRYLRTLIYQLESYIDEFQFAKESENHYDYDKTRSYFFIENEEKRKEREPQVA